MVLYIYIYIIYIYIYNIYIYIYVYIYIYIYIYVYIYMDGPLGAPKFSPEVVMEPRATPPPTASETGVSGLGGVGCRVCGLGTSGVGLG